MDHPLVAVEGYVASRPRRANLRDEVWTFALDQRAFGPRRLLVAFADRCGRFRALAHAARTDPPELGLVACIAHLGRGAAAAVAFCDEPVAPGPPPPGLALRFATARAVAEAFGVHLVDWLACDDLHVRSTRLALDPDRPWWDVP